MNKILLLTFTACLLGGNVADSSLYISTQEKPTEAVKTQNTIKQVCNVSAYSASVRECGKDDGITASGVKATEGRTVACDHLPFGTTIRINGHDYIVEDRFGGGYTNRIDIYHENEQDAWDFGRQELEIEIVKEL